jgi:hypothetical protein
MLKMLVSEFRTAFTGIEYELVRKLKFHEASEQIWRTYSFVRPTVIAATVLAASTATLRCRQSCTRPT